MGVPREVRRVSCDDVDRSKLTLQLSGEAKYESFRFVE